MTRSSPFNADICSPLVFFPLLQWSLCVRFISLWYFASPSVDCFGWCWAFSIAFISICVLLISSNWCVCACQQCHYVSILWAGISVFCSPQLHTAIIHSKCSWWHSRRATTTFLSMYSKYGISKWSALESQEAIQRAREKTRQKTNRWTNCRSVESVWKYVVTFQWDTHRPPDQNQIEQWTRLNAVYVVSMGFWFEYSYGAHCY